MKKETVIVCAIMFATAVAILYLFPYKKLTEEYVPKKLMRDYQLEIVGEHTIRMYDGDRLVGQFPYDEDTLNPTYLDNEILIDNK